MKHVMTWSEFENGGTHLAAHLVTEPIDLIVGIARGGLPLAVFLSHRLGCRTFGTVLVQKTKSDTITSFDWRDTLTVAESALPNIRAETALIVDDIVAYGDAFTAVEELLCNRYGGGLRCLHAALFADVTQIKAGPYAPLLEKLCYGEDIDNTTTWIVFPWERLTE